VKAGAHVGPYAVIGRGVVVEEDAHVRRTIVWPNSRIGQGAVLDGPILGRNTHVGRNARIEHAAVLGDKTVLTDFTTL
jgi:NDP-sugar pyrophosphorylase family protein